MIIGTQAVQTLLVTLGITVGVALLLTLSFLGAGAAWHRYDRKEHISALERYLAEVARQHRPSANATDGIPR